MKKLAHDMLTQLLEQVQAGELPIDTARELLQTHTAEPLGFATVDHARRQRCGAAEVIFAAGKTPGQVAAIAQAIRKREPAVLVTRAEKEHIAALTEAFTGDEIVRGRLSGTVLIGEPCVQPATAIPIVTAGTSDLTVAEEAAMTCRAMGHAAVEVNDVGVAGLHRLAGHVQTLRQANVIICIAGMEGALPSVVGGLVDVPVIAVPTSTGYGAAFGGVAALLGMLTSCASGVTVVNIDNGFGAAYNACLINRLACGLRGERGDGLDDET